MSNPPSYDQDLLARLNALKKSAITLETNEPSLSIPKTQRTPESDLAARLRSLRHGSGAGQGSSSSGPSFLGDATELPAFAAQPLPGFSASDLSFLDAGDDVKDLLNDVDLSKDWAPQSVDEVEVKSLLNEARNVVAKGPRPGRSLPNLLEAKSKKKFEEEEGLDSESADAEDAEEEQEQVESREADDIIARLLDEIELEDYTAPKPDAERSHEGNHEALAITSPNAQHKNTTTAPNQPDKPSTTHTTTTATEDAKDEEELRLPSTPSQDPTTRQKQPQTQDAAATTTTSALASDFEANIARRMAALRLPTSSISLTSVDALDLPSAPTTLPSKASRTPAPAPKEVPETWCIICSDDATVLCYGCETPESGFGEGGGALYCARCWKEGHLGRDVGLEERGHEWVRWKRPT